MLSTTKLRIVVNTCARLKLLTRNGSEINFATQVSDIVCNSKHARTLFTMPALKVTNSYMDKQTVVSVRQISTSTVLMKVKNKGQKKPQHLDLRELGEVFNVDKLMNEFKKPIDNLKQDFARQISLRSTVGALEELPIKFDGKEYQLQELAQISRKPKLVVLNLDVHPQTAQAVMDALRSSRMNLNPQQEKTTIYIPIPKITKEHREKLSKTAKALFHQCRDKLGMIQTDYLKKMKNKEGLSIPTCQRIQECIDSIRHQHINEAQMLLDAKQKELLGEEN